MLTINKELNNLKNNVKPIHIYMDTEYENDQFLTTQIVIGFTKPITLLIVPESLYILYNKNIDLTLLHSKNIELVIQQKNELISDIVFKYIHTVQSDIQKCFLHFYFSSRDLEYYFGRSFFLTLVREKKIESKNNLKGEFCIEYNGKPIKIKLQDKSGWGKKGGLKKLCETFGITHNTKSELDHYKKNMSECCKTPSLMMKLIEYGMEDAWVLKEIHEKMLGFLSNVMTSLLGIPKELQTFTIDNLPSTIGSIVAKIIEAYIYKEFSTSLSNGCLTKAKEYLKVFKDINLKISVNPSIIKGIGKRSTNRISDLLNGCGITSIAYLYRNNTGCLNALVQGGRTFNEQLWDYRKKFIRDIDMAGCYGNALQSFVYPIGLPSIEAVTDLNKCSTLKQFLKKYKHELVDNLYTITIKGKLSFSQTLLYSKITDSTKMKETFDEILNQNGDIHQVNADFVLLENQLENTIITSDILETLQAVCNPTELSEIKNCKVLTAAFYKKSDEIKDTLEWLEHMKNQDSIMNDFSYDFSTQSIHDKRSRKWCSIKLDGFFRPLIKERKRLKLLMVEDPKLKYFYNAEQELIKLIINTVYGVIASAFFRVGNTILANNITARARNSVWLYSRVLNGIQSITDGFAYQPDFVNTFKKNVKRKPGLQTLSDLRVLQKHRFIEQVSLGGLNWAELILKNDLKCSQFKESDRLAMDHINRFLSHYNLPMKYELEHKPDNNGVQLFYIKKSHYIIQKPDGEIEYKVRGTNKLENPVLMDIAMNIFHNENNYIQKTRSRTRLNTLHDYKQSIKKAVLNPEEPILYPGYDREEVRTYRFDSNDLPCSTLKEYKERLKTDTDIGYLIESKSFDKLFQMRNNNIFKSKIVVNG